MKVKNLNINLADMGVIGKVDPKRLAGMSEDQRIFAVKRVVTEELKKHIQAIVREIDPDLLNLMNDEQRKKLATKIVEGIEYARDKETNAEAIKGRGR